MHRIVVSCEGASEAAARAGVEAILEEFAARPWHKEVACRWDGRRIVLSAVNDFDSSGQALLDEFSDAVCACLPIEEAAIRFCVESVVRIAADRPV